MARLSKEDIIKVVVESARLYKKNLQDKTLLFVLMDKRKNISFEEVSFRKNNFLHLTGLKINKKDLSAEQFFNFCIDGRLSGKDFSVPEGGTTVLKLQILPYLLTKNLNANSFGDFGGNGFRLYTEKLAGGVKGCIGFVKAEETLEWVPNTLLNEDIRKISKNGKRVIATYRKQREEEKYTEMVYCAKKIDWEQLCFPESHAYLQKLICVKENHVVEANVSNENKIND